MRDYQVISPSLEGVLGHDFIQYGGIRRPVELLRILDGVSMRGAEDDTVGDDMCKTDEDRVALENYFHDLYAVFMKKLSYFFVQGEVDPEETVRLMAMLQEMIKIKKLMNKLGKMPMKM